MAFFGLFKSKKEKEKSKKYKLGLHKTREGAFKTLHELLNNNTKIDDDLFDELEEIFIMADIGVDTVVKFIDELKEEVYHKKISDASLLSKMIIDKMFEIYLKGEIVNANLNLHDGLNVILFVGVNGVGKTTSIAKIAYKLKKEGKKVLLAAGDTFRAGAIEQLSEWARRIGVEIVTKAAGSDPSSVMFDAVNKAKQENYDVLLCDTAGRLQNKVNLMAELSKINRVIEREAPGEPTETLLVIDATTGQNGMTQAKVFSETTNVSGVILTKLDGTAKGGIVLAIRNELGIPIKFIGLGEGLDDLEVLNHIFTDCLRISSMIDLEKREEVIALYDIYNELLTDKQKMYFEEYYYCDMTLQEIASLHNISRNAVFDQLKKTISICEKYENSLHNLKNQKLLNQALELNSLNDIKEIIKNIIKE